MKESRLVPFTVAGLICFAAAFLLGASAWYFFGTKAPAFRGGNNTIVQTSNQNPAAANSTENSVQNSNAALPTPSATPAEQQKEQLQIKLAPAGEVKVTGGEVTLGGGDTNLPLRRVVVGDFAVGGTEVTNAQYAEFVQAAAHRAPFGWKDGKFPAGAENYPVGWITWKDANDYCEWLSKELGATVRLPTEAEWERAARGDTDYKYPWGSDWNDEAAHGVGGEAKGTVHAVKSASAGRSPFGAYEMAGNVWEWTSDLWTDESGKPVLFGRSTQRVIKGGSVKESGLKAEQRDTFLTIDARLNRPEFKTSDLLGFRYVVIRGQ
jgi:formylglycine-generating enzyme required for sulfatase activity